MLWIILACTDAAQVFSTTVEVAVEGEGHSIARSVPVDVNLSGARGDCAPTTVFYIRSDDLFLGAYVDETNPRVPVQLAGGADGVVLTDGALGESITSRDGTLRASRFDENEVELVFEGTFFDWTGAIEPWQGTMTLGIPMRGQDPGAPKACFRQAEPFEDGRCGGGGRNAPCKD